MSRIVLHLPDKIVLPWISHEMAAGIILMYAVTGFAMSLLMWYHEDDPVPVMGVVGLGFIMAVGWPLILMVLMREVYDESDEEEEVEEGEDGDDDGEEDAEDE